MEHVQRDYNGVAKALLVLSMISVIMAIITSFQQIKLNSYLGIGNASLISEIVVDFCILVAAGFTFMKNRYGLIALVSLFVIRIFATIPIGGNVAYSYQLGSKTVLFLRDFGLFAIAMCFRKGGASGWKSMLASQRYLDAHMNVSESDSSETLLCSAVVTDEVKPIIVSEEKVDSSLLTETLQMTDLGEEVVKNKDIKHEGVDRHVYVQSRPLEELLSTRIRSLSKEKKILVVALTTIIVVIVLIVTIVSLKQYPNYVTSFGDKWRYSFNITNNKLAESIMGSMYDSRYSSSCIVAVPGEVEIFTADRFYRNRKDLYRDFSSIDVYFSQKKITKREDVKKTDWYIVVTNNNSEWAYHGDELYTYWELWVESLQAVVYETSLYDYDSALKAEFRKVDEAASIPVNDLDIIDEIGGFYEKEENYSKAADFYEHILEREKNNAEVQARLSYVMARNGDFEKACEIANEAIQKNPKENLAYCALAIVGAESYNWGEAKKYSKKAIDYGTDNSDAYFIYAEALFKQNEVKAAREYYNKAYEMYFSNPLAEKYSECAGCPFDVLSFEFGFSDGNQKTITDYGEKLFSSKSKFIDIKLSVNYLRYDGAEIGVKLYVNGKLSTGQVSKNGYSYTQKIGGNSPGVATLYLKSWGANYAGCWPRGDYEIEIWYKTEKIANESFKIY